MYELHHACHKVYSIKYHMMFCIKYRKSLFQDDKIIEYFKEILRKIGERYYFTFETIGIDENHIHLLVQSAPRYAPSRVAQIIKSISAIELFKKFPELKEDLWGGEFWNDGGYIGTIGEGVNADIIRKYIQQQGRTTAQLKLSDF
jgi:putative transposase